MPDEQPTSETPAPRKAKSSPARKTSKAKAKSKKSTARTARVTTFTAETARLSNTGQTLRVLEPFVNAPTTRASASFTFVTIPGLEDAQQKLSTALNDFMGNVTEAIQKLTTLDVKTYTSDDIEGITLDKQGNLVGSKNLRAMTAISLTGDIQAVIPMRSGSMDETLWAAHVDMVKQAQENRTELVKLAASAVSGLISVIKPV